MKFIRESVNDILNVLFPARCHVCGGKLAPGERFACAHCLNTLPRSGYHRRRLNPMEERFAGIFPFTRATGHFFYSRGSALSLLIQDMKYRRFPGIGEMLGHLAASELYATGFFAETDVVVPVPMHWLKRVRRGYNQADHIAAGISRATGLPVVKALQAVRGHKTQTSMTMEERLENTSGLFSVVEPSAIDGKGVLLIDDVCTTGSTLISAATTLTRETPGCRVTILTLGVTF